MKYTICESMMWHAMMPAMLRWLRQQEPDWDIAALKRDAKKSSFRKKELFTAEAQKKRMENAEKGNRLSDSPFNWNTEVILGRDVDEYTILYHQCGLCVLGRQENLLRLVPYMCVLDTLSVEWMGGVLYRTKTLAEGGDCCDFHMCRKGSEWDEEK